RRINSLIIISWASNFISELDKFAILPSTGSELMEFPTVKVGNVRRTQVSIRHLIYSTSRTGS
ncbi:hypothetical protein AB643_24655, partial [Salmonella enterica]|nr:hypothetical protein [Salmonella enterica]